MCVVPGAAYALMSKFDGVNAVVWVATTRPSTDSVAWWFTAPNSIHVDCGCPESGTVMLREYTASFTSVKPCLYQPPPGTVIDVAARPAGVKLHVPARSTEAIAALPAVTPSGAEAGAVAAAERGPRGGRRGRLGSHSPGQQRHDSRGPKGQASTAQRQYVMSLHTILLVNGPGTGR